MGVEAAFCISPCMEYTTDFLQLNMKDFQLTYVGNETTENVI